ncbi:MAG: tetratricopeptide repeat protein [Planctomycetes bacterium]|nr:tetratricopeptide repeat protein [Planctomycetota bacterium]
MRPELGFIFGLAACLAAAVGCGTTQIADGNPRVDKGDAVWQPKESDKAIEDSTRVIELSPDDYRGYYARGVVLSGRKEYDNALKDLDKAIELNPDYDQAYQDRGLVRFDKTDFDGAIADWEQAIRLNPSFEKELRPEIDRARQARVEKTDAENFKTITDFYRKKFPKTSFRNLAVGARFTDGGPANKTGYHIFVPREIEQVYLYPYAEGFLRKQLAGDDPLGKMIADNLLQLKKGVLFSQPGATESHDGAPEIECVDYVTPFKYYLLEHPVEQSIPGLKELLNDKDKDVRAAAESALKTLGVPEKEIAEAKEESDKIDINKASELIIAHIFKGNPRMNPAARFAFIESTTPEIFEEMGFQVFVITSEVRYGWSYIIYRKRVFDFLDGIRSMCAADIDGNGQPEMIFTVSGGSGIHASTVGICYKDGASIRKSTASFYYSSPQGDDLFARKQDQQTVAIEIRRPSGESAYGGDFIAELGQVRIENKAGVLTCALKENPNLPGEIKKYIHKTQPAKEGK